MHIGSSILLSYGMYVYILYTPSARTLSYSRITGVIYFVLANLLPENRFNTPNGTNRMFAMLPNT